MIRIGIVGSTGLVGESLIRVLLGHPEAELTLLGSESSAGKPITEALPSLQGLIDRRCEKADPERLSKACDAIILASKSPEVMAYVPPLLEAGKKVIDIGGEFRLNSAELYEKWYKEKHLCPAMLARAVYGLPEFNRRKIREASLVANPGCYATTATLAIAPFAAKRMLADGPVAVDAFSGLSGAGRVPTDTNTFVRCNENVKGYKFGNHRHSPEIEQELTKIAGGAPQRVLFLPHVVPLDRGIYCTSFLDTKEQVSAQDALALIRKQYEGEPFIRVFDDPTQIELQSVRDTNFCDLSAYADPKSRKVMVFSALDNMIKGAAGQAIQNLNLMFGLEETLGLANRRMI